FKSASIRAVNSFNTSGCAGLGRGILLLYSHAQGTTARLTALFHFLAVNVGFSGSGNTDPVLCRNNGGFPGIAMPARPFDFYQDFTPLHQLPHFAGNFIASFRPALPILIMGEKRILSPKSFTETDAL
ncbi:MAG: hypothetical protein LBF78_07070, partial [Treponema sp.]|nr:hypothetical protein [Treponema sp.]